MPNLRPSPCTQEVNDTYWNSLSRIHSSSLFDTCNLLITAICITINFGVPTQIVFLPLHLLHLQPALCFTSSISSQFSTSQVQILVTNYLVMNFSGIRPSLALNCGLRTSHAIILYCRTFSAAVETKPARRNTVFLLKIWEYG